MKLSVIIPVYNERTTIALLLQRVREVGLEKEVIVVDDGSTDGTGDILEASRDQIDTLLYHNRNRGKGAAIRTGLEKATGHVVVIQDADLEYDPQEYYRLIQPIADGRADVVYGSRFIGGDEHRVLFFWHFVGNRFLTLLSNMFTNLNLSDMEVGYKMFKTDVLKRIKIEQHRFGFEPEITAKVAKMRCRIYEIGISYSGRDYTEGKKIRWKDGVWAIWCILKYGLRRKV